MQQEKNSIQLLAVAAKKRMLNGYNSYIAADIVSKDNDKVITFEKSTLPISPETNCYKIYEAMQENTINPLEKLIDKDYLSTLSPADRQRYIFRLSEAYINVKRKIVGEERYK